MITGSLDTLQRTPLPAPLNRIVAEVVQSVERWLHAPLGKQEVDGLMLFCLVSEDLTEPVADRRGEFHEQYLDIQLLLRGEDSPLLLPETAARMLERPGTELAVIPGCGHAPALNVPAQLDVVSNFIGRAERSVNAIAA